MLSSQPRLHGRDGQWCMLGGVDWPTTQHGLVRELGAGSFVRRGPTNDQLSARAAHPLEAHGCSAEADLSPAHHVALQQGAHALHWGNGA